MRRFNRLALRRMRGRITGPVFRIHKAIIRVLFNWVTDTGDNIVTDSGDTMVFKE